jgi:hypothetical protein
MRTGGERDAAMERQLRDADQLEVALTLARMSVHEVSGWA